MRTTIQKQLTRLREEADDLEELLGALDDDQVFAMPTAQASICVIEAIGRLSLAGGHLRKVLLVENQQSRRR